MQLRRADVVAGALALLDAEGLDGLTMRRLAAHLGVQASALYWHFANKQALLDAMADKLVEGAGDALPPGTWEEQLATLAHRLRAALLAHRDGARVVAGTYVTDSNTTVAGDAAIAVLRRAGFSAERAGWTLFAISYYVLGHTIEEQARADLIAAGEWATKRADAADLEDVDGARALGAVMDADPAERFGYGLGVFIDGLRHQLSAIGRGN